MEEYMSSARKKLIGSDNIEELIQGKTTVTLGREILLTPGAKDALRNRGITLRYQERAAEPSCLLKQHVGVSEERETQAGERQNITETVVRLLNEEYGISDPEELREISLRVVEEICMGRNFFNKGDK